MISMQACQHLLVPAGVQDSVQDDVVALVQAVAGDVIDQPDVHPAGPVVLLQDDPPDQILGDPGQAASVRLAEHGGDRALAGPGIPPHDDEPRHLRAGRYAYDPRPPP
jgi:hypothetical protein